MLFKLLFLCLPQKGWGWVKNQHFFPCFPLLALKQTHHASGYRSRAQLALTQPLHGIATWCNSVDSPHMNWERVLRADATLLTGVSRAWTEFEAPLAPLSSFLCVVNNMCNWYMVAHIHTYTYILYPVHITCFYLINLHAILFPVAAVTNTIKVMS